MIRNTGKNISLLCLAISLATTNLSNAAASDIIELVKPCAGCHGKDGASTESDIPIISGNSAVYLIDAMTTYKNKERPCPEIKIKTGPDKDKTTDMCKIAADLSEEDSKLVADYFASKPFVRAKQSFDADKAEQGKIVQNKECKKCHENGGSSAADDAGILAGQWSPYLRQQFKDFSSGDRPMTKKMKTKYDKLSEADKENLIHYFASFN
ncbi:MAG: c-type cytochrome [Gammaproteobacteria bacterium]|nr:c-type cytochrome [Gammaproteobacteria bacterium]MDH5735565.1 c-type cytochrome [Gammaproteobacteria bacterium]